MIDYIGFRITPDEKQRAEQAAEKDGRTLSNWVKMAMKERIEKQEASK